jgi:hypothetical protein
MAKKAFDRTELLRIFGCNKTRGPSGRFHPGRPADSMNDTTCRNIRRDEHAKRPPLKTIKRASAL